MNLLTARDNGFSRMVRKTPDLSYNSGRNLGSLLTNDRQQRMRSSRNIG